MACDWAYEAILGMAFPPNLVPHRGCCSGARKTTLRRNSPPAKVFPGAFVLQRQEGLAGENPDIVFNRPGGRLADSLLPFFFFDAAEEKDIPLSTLGKAIKRRRLD